MRHSDLAHVVIRRKVLVEGTFVEEIAMVKTGQLLKAKKTKQSREALKSVSSMLERERNLRSGNNSFSIGRVRKTPAGKIGKGR